jgi:hypothetical protein
MAKRKAQLASLMLMLTAGAAASPAESFGAGNLGPLAVVASPSFPADGISFGDLKRLYMGSTVVAGGKSLVPLTYPKQSPERQGFDEAVLGMTAEQVGLYWIDRKIRGQSGPPKSVESGSVILKVVTKVDGAIGFVKAGSVGKDVKVLRIDGKLPTDRGYRL